MRISSSQNFSYLTRTFRNVLLNQLEPVLRMDGLVSSFEFIQFPLKCLKVYGLIPYDNGDGKWLKKRLLAIYHYFLIANLSICMLMFVFYVKNNLTRLELITENVALPGYGVLAIVKSISILLRRAEFQDLVDTLTELFPKNKEDQKAFNIRSYFRGYKLVEQVSAFLITLACLGFIVVPIGKFAMTGIWIRKFPFENAYPFDEYDEKFFAPIFVWTCFNMSTCLMSLLGPDLILYAFITLISMNFDILCTRLRRLKDVPTAETAKKLVKLVKLHRTLIRLSDNLEQIYSPSIFINVFGSSVLICLAGYAASTAVDVYMVLKFTQLLVGSLVQVMIVCYCGTKLTDASLKVSNAAYDCGWNGEWKRKESREIKMALLMMVQRSQKPTVITAYKFTVVSLNAFTTASIVLISFKDNSLIYIVSDIELVILIFDSSSHFN